VGFWCGKPWTGAPLPSIGFRVCGRVRAAASSRITAARARVESRKHTGSKRLIKGVEGPLQYSGSGAQAKGPGLPDCLIRGCPLR
jgi:hypothetical protein